VVTETTPLVPAPIVAKICVLVLDAIVAEVPPNVTVVAPLRFVPVIVTVLPCPVVTGENAVMVGAVTKLKLDVESVLPPVFAIVTTPLVPVPITAVI
jgi:hypothetical protein